VKYIPEKSLANKLQCDFRKLDQVGAQEQKVMNSIMVVLGLLMVMPLKFGNPENTNVHHHYYIETEKDLYLLT
jgi:hypothetical protein